jgi:hypothetical protein
MFAASQKIQTDSSREESPVEIGFAKPIPFAQLFDKEASALNDITINCHPEIIHFVFVHCVIPTGFDFLLQFGYQCCVPSGT